MKISSIAYLRFYEVLYEEFVKKTWTKQDQKVPDSTSSKAWLEKNPETGEFYFFELFDDTVNDPEHFIRKRKDIERNNPDTVQFKASLLIRTCQFIGFSIPDHIDRTNTHLTLEMKARILYQFFLEKHYPEHLAGNRAELEVYNHKTGELLKNNNGEKHSNESEPMTDDQLRAAIEEKDVRQLIGRFYEYISHSRLEEAWDLLAPVYRKRNWKDDFESFRIGYTNTVSIHHVHIFDITRQSSGIKCKIYYEDDVITYTSIELGNIGKIPISDYENFSERVKRLIAAAANAGLEGFEKIELQKLFEPALSEYVWYRCGMDPNKIAEFLPSQETRPIPRLYIISCVRIENDWFINSINPVNPHSIR